MEATRTEFINIITQQFEAWCEETNQQASPSLFAQYMVNRSLVCDKTIKRFLVVHNYPETLQKNMEIKQSAVWDLEERYKLSSSTIYGILNRFASSFFYKNRI